MKNGYFHHFPQNVKNGKIQQQTRTIFHFFLRTGVISGGVENGGYSRVHHCWVMHCTQKKPGERPRARQRGAAVCRDVDGPVRGVGVPGVWGTGGTCVLCYPTVVRVRVLPTALCTH